MAIVKGDFHDFTIGNRLYLCYTGVGFTQGFSRFHALHYTEQGGINSMVFRPRGYTRLFSRYRGPLSVLVQGMLVVIIGLALVLFNLNDNVSYQKITGHVVNAYEETDSFGQYSSSWVQLDSSKDLFNFDKDGLHPAASQPFIRGQEITIYYTNDTPPQVAAIQFYNQFGDPTTKDVSDPYQQNPNTYSIGIGPIPGLVVLLIGLLVIAFGGFKYKQARDHMREEAEEAARPSSFASRNSTPYATLPPKYVSPSKSLPSQADSPPDYSFKEFKE